MPSRIKILVESKSIIAAKWEASRPDGWNLDDPAHDFIDAEPVLVALLRNGQLGRLVQALPSTAPIEVEALEVCSHCGVAAVFWVEIGRGEERGQVAFAQVLPSPSRDQHV